MSSVRTNFIWNSAYQVVRIAIPLVTTPYLTRVLGSESLGTYSYSYTIAMYFTYFVLLGLNQYGNREIAKTRGDRCKLSRTFWSIYLGQLSIGAVVSIAYVALSLSQDGIISTCLLIWTVWVFAEVADISWLFYGLEEFRIITIRNVLIRIGVVVGIFAFVKGSEDLWLYCALQAASFALNSIILWLLARTRLNWCRVTLNEVLAHIRPSLTLFAPVIAVSCYTQLNKLMLGFFSGMSQVAFYDNADKVVTIPLTFIQSLGTVLLPRMSSVLAAGDQRRALAYLSDSFWISMAASIGLLCGIAGIAESFVPLFFGDGFEECERLLSILALIIPACSISSVIGNQFLIPTERDSVYLKSVFAGAIANIALCIVLVPPLKATGAALATAVAEYVVTGIQVWYARDKIPIGRFFRESSYFILFGLTEYVAIKAASFTRFTGAVLLCIEISVGVITFAGFGFAYLLLKKDRHLQLFGLSKFINKER